MPRPVLLFKEPTPDDSYERSLNSMGYQARSVPVLQTTPTNLDSLLEYLANPQELRGVVITSKRSCDSLSEALERIFTDSSKSTPIPSLAHWSTIPFYVVGEATASSIRDIQVRFQRYGFTSVQTLGESTGTGEQLGHFIVERYHQHMKGGKLLCLTGDKNRDTVYETQQRPDFEKLLENAVNAFQSDAKADPWWTVCFAPSTANFAIPAVQKLLGSRNISTRIATIGPVTTSFIEKTLALPVHATAPKPAASALAEVMLSYERNNAG